MALQNYHQANGCFPPAYIADKNGKPMHSWRVLILPYLDRTILYKAYDFTEPWDGPNNKKLSATRSRAFTARATPATDVGRHGPDKLCRRGGTERRLGGRQAEETRAILRARCLQHDHARRGGQLGHLLGGTAGLVAGRSDAAGRRPPALAMSSNHGRNDRVLLHV